MYQVQKLLLLVATIAFVAGCTPKSAITETKDETKVVAESVKEEVKIKNPEKPLGTISFEASSPRYDAVGSFKNWSFTNFKMSKGDITTLNATIEVDMMSVSEASSGLVDHLKKWDFFDVEKFPKATVDISDVTPAKNGYMAKAMVKIKDGKKEFPTSFTMSGKNMVKGEITIDREAFNVGLPFEKREQLTKQVKVTYETKLPM